MRIIETVWIPLSDGCRLAARLWLPDESSPVPAILEYLPYRRRDQHRGDDAVLHPGLAGCGYAALRVDMRGAGDSDGLMNDEYTPQEWRDACEVIAWIAAQDWCSGSVGLIGISWSGFNALQIAALRPPALKAIVTACSTDDRYADDMHYMGGALLNDNLQYGATLFTWTPTPPDPAIVGDRWKAMWLARLNAMDLPPAARWMQHPQRDDYWRSGSVCEDYGRITVPVLAVGGWADGYTNTVLRLLENLRGPRKGLIGPWGHAFPHIATPGPRIDFIGYVQRWFDQWLQGRESGIMAEPMLAHWQQRPEPPRARYVQRQGHWAAERRWPSADVRARTLHLAPGRLQDTPAQFTATLSSPATTGLASGEWCPYGWGPDMPGDQREDDAGSLCFDGPPVATALQLLGRAEVRLELCADNPLAMLAVRLNAVAPDGTAIRVSYGLLNLAARNGFDRAEPLVPGHYYQINVLLKAAAFVLPAGYRLRVALSTCYWPLAAPLPVRPVLTVQSGSVILPLRDPDAEVCPPPVLGDPWSPPPVPARVLVAPARGRQRVIRDMDDGETTLEVVRNLGAVELAETGLRLEVLGREIYRVNAHDPAGGWRLESTLDAWDGEEPCFSRRWRLNFPFFPPPGDEPA